MECEYCNKKLSSKYSLTRHQKSVKSCLKIQRSKNIEIREYDIQCDKCLKKYRCNSELKNHVCLKEKVDEIENNEVVERLVNELREKDKIILELSKKDNITNNTNTTVINNFIPSMSICNLTTPEITEKGKKYPLDFNKGTSALANFAIEHIVNVDGENFYFCTDRSRGRFKFIDNDGKLVEDPECQYLYEKLFAGINPIYKKYMETFTLPKDHVSRVGEFFNINNGRKPFIKEIKGKLPASYTDNKFSFKEEERRRIQDKRNLEYKEPIYDHFNHKKVLEMIKCLPEDELINLDNKYNLIKFAISLLIHNKRLLYNYDREEEIFYYYEDLDTRRTEKEPEFIHYVSNTVRDVFSYNIIKEGIHGLESSSLKNILKGITYTCEHYSEYKQIIINILTEISNTLDPMEMTE